MERKSSKLYVGMDVHKESIDLAVAIETAKKGGVTISAHGFTEANKADYKAAIEAVVVMATNKAQAQKDAKMKR